MCDGFRPPPCLFCNKCPVSGAASVWHFASLRHTLLHVVFCAPHRNHPATPQRSRSSSKHPGESPHGFRNMVEGFVDVRGARSPPRCFMRPAYFLLLFLKWPPVHGRAVEAVEFFRGHCAGMVPHGSAWENGRGETVNYAPSWICGMVAPRIFNRRGANPRRASEAADGRWTVAGSGKWSLFVQPVVLWGYCGLPSFVGAGRTFCKRRRAEPPGEPTTWKPLIISPWRET